MQTHFSFSNTVDKVLIDNRCYIKFATKSFCFRENLAELEEISKTELTCAWLNQKSVVQDKYKAVSIKDMPCFLEKINSYTSDSELETSMRHYFIENLPNSTIAKHK